MSKDEKKVVNASIQEQLTMVDNRGENFDGNNISSPSLENSFESKKTEDNIQGVDIDDEVPF